MAIDFVQSPERDQLGVSHFDSSFDGYETIAHRFVSAKPISCKLPSGMFMTLSLPIWRRLLVLYRIIILSVIKISIIIAIIICPVHKASNVPAVMSTLYWTRPHKRWRKSDDIWHSIRLQHAWGCMRQTAWGRHNSRHSIGSSSWIRNERRDVTKAGWRWELITLVQRRPAVSCGPNLRGVDVIIIIIIIIAILSYSRWQQLRQLDAVITLYKVRICLLWKNIAKKAPCLEL